MKPADTRLSAPEIELSDAARDGNLEAVQKLLAAGVKPDVKDDRYSLRNVTPLMRAARRGHLEIVRALLAAGANVNARDKHISSEEAGGHTPLHYAAKQRHLEVAKVLLKAGADINAVGTRFLGTPLCEAMIGDSEIQPAPKELLAGVKQKPASDEERNKILEFTKFLLASGANPNIESKENKSVPLDGAMLRGLTDTAAALLDAGADPNHQDREGNTALSSALLKDHVEAALLLLKRGLRVDLENNDGWTDLYFAVALNHPKVVAAMLEAGADAHHKDKEGKTPLDWAIQKKCTEIQELLRRTAK